MFRTEFAILKSVTTGLRTIVASPAPKGCSYVEKHFLGMLGLVLAVGALPEIPVHHLFIGGRDWPIAVGLDLILVYSALWVLGVYGIMARRPHEVQSQTIVFHHGPFAHVNVPREALDHAEVVRAERAREARRRHPDAYALNVPGGEFVYVRLKQPAKVVHTYPARFERTVNALLVPSDRPQELCALLR